MATLRLGADPKKELERVLMSAEQAAALVRSGEQIWIPSGHAPPSILEAIARREPELRDVKVRSTIVPDVGWFRRDAMASFDLQVQYALMPQNREALHERIADFHPYSMLMQHKAIDAGRPE